MTHIEFKKSELKNHFNFEKKYNLQFIPRALHLIVSMAYIILTHLEISNFKDWNHQHDIGHTCDSHPHGVLQSNEKIIEI